MAPSHLLILRQLNVQLTFGRPRWPRKCDPNLAQNVLERIVNRYQDQPRSPDSPTLDRRNISSFGLIPLEAETAGLPAYRKDIQFPNPDFFALARACGGRVFRATKPDRKLCNGKDQGSLACRYRTITDRASPQPV
jgi:hypothetical protein